MVAATYSYDAASQLTGIFYQGGAMVPGNLAYSYDMAGRRTGVSGSLASTQLPAAVASAAYVTPIAASLKYTDQIP